MDYITQLFAFAGGLEVPALNFVGQIVKVLYEWLGSYGWAVVLFTVFLKLITLPLDVWQRYMMKKNSIQMQKMQPMLEKIDTVYANDKRKANEEKLKLYKKQGYSTLASCLPTIVTMAVFIFMYSGLTSYTAYANVKDYNALEKTYQTQYEYAIGQGKSNEEAISFAKEKTGEYYESNKESFLWIKNIWRPDNWNEPMPTYDEFTRGSMGVQGVGTDLLNENIYNNIRDGVLAQAKGYKIFNGNWNGLLILPILSIALSFFSTKITGNASGMKDKKSAETDPMASQQKMMMFMMPIMMGFFSLMYSAAFALYLVCNSTLTILSSLALNPIVERAVKKKLAETDTAPSYRR